MLQVVIFVVALFGAIWFFGIFASCFREEKETIWHSGDDYFTHGVGYNETRRSTIFERPALGCTTMILGGLCSGVVLALLFSIPREIYQPIFEGIHTFWGMTLSILKWLGIVFVGLLIVWIIVTLVIEFVKALINDISNPR